MDYDAEVAKLASPMGEDAFVAGDVAEFKALLTMQILLGNHMDLLKKRMIYGKDGFEPINHEPNTTNIPLTQDEYELIHASMGIITEAGEIAEIVLDYINTGELSSIHLNEERGDLLWYLALITKVGKGLLPLEGCMKQNMDKLWTRYKGKKFSKDEALNRNLEEEGKALKNA